MNEKTEELRSIFLDATGEETVTERQEETHGSLAEDESENERRVRELVATMRDRYDFETSLDDDDLYRIVRGFYDDEDDETIAVAVDATAEEVFVARMDLHLVRDADRGVPVEFDRLRDRVVAGASDANVAADLGVDESTVARARRVIEAEQEATRANDRFRDEFAEHLTDSDLSARLARDAREDGLEDATEDIETNVSF
ncbi:conditioned medium-induced protein 4 [Haloplanus sp. GCM10025708]|uniref:conditioned medium-induced protein 4 n=1 Tax=Haloferacaceae TaxID=1644056 RepID=UPI00360D6BFA